MKVMLLTGGSGFIGSNFTKYFLRRNKNYIVVNIDKLSTPSGKYNIAELGNSPRYHFIKGDICNGELVDYLLRKYRPCHIINFASSPLNYNNHGFIPSQAATDIMGMTTLLEGIKYIWKRRNLSDCMFIQISSSDTYGTSNTPDNYFLEESPLNPQHPHTALKASADLILNAFSKTYNIPALILRCCEAYGPYQNTENPVPAFITNILEDKPSVVHNSSLETKEWMHVADLSIAIIKALFYGKPGEIYNIGSGETASYKELAEKILKLTSKPQNLLQIEGPPSVVSKSCLLNSFKAKNNLHWSSKLRLNDGLNQTIMWYKENPVYWNEK